MKSWYGSVCAGLAGLGVSRSSCIPSKISFILIPGCQFSSSFSIDKHTVPLGYICSRVSRGKRMFCVSSWSSYFSQSIICSYINMEESLWKLDFRWFYGIVFWKVHCHRIEPSIPICLLAITSQSTFSQCQSSSYRNSQRAHLLHLFLEFYTPTASGLRFHLPWLLDAQWIPIWIFHTPKQIYWYLLRFLFNYQGTWRYLQMDDPFARIFSLVVGGPLLTTS